LLKEFTLDLEQDLSLVIGKNNSGKTSILTALDKFLNQTDKKAIVFDDFNVDLRKKIEAILLGNESIESEEDYSPLGIELKLYIEYLEADDLSLVSPLIMSLDPDDNNIVVCFEYKISFSKLVDLKRDYVESADKYENSPSLFIKEKFHEYFGPVQRKSLLSANESEFIDLKKENISLKDILAFEFISAKRSVTNEANNSSLSQQTSKIYKKIDESLEQVETSDNFKRELRNTDTKLNRIYKDMFSGVIENVSQFGGLNPSDTDLTVASTLQHKDLLDGNTTVLYKHDSHELPEHYNGLGYMNLISMIFDIDMRMSRLRRSLKENPAAINLFFIEEPEAHTHPQMQYVFIKNIKELLSKIKKREDGVVMQLQTVITTHSSHITSESDFDDIKYLRRCSDSKGVVSKNLKALESAYSSSNPEEDEKLKRAFRFLKQYLTLNRAELFFADKAVFIEGDTERILIPAMMKKLDQENAVSEEELPLLSQNISIVEVGAHAQTFEKFIDFIGVKSLIITDIDSQYIESKVGEGGKEVTSTVKCKPSDPRADRTSNSSLKFFYGSDDLIYFKGLDVDNRLLEKVDGSWVISKDGHLLMVYQNEEGGYHARSFEDAFFSINKSFLGNDPDAFPSLVKKHFKRYVENTEADPFDFAKDAVDKKPSLAIEILMNSKPKEDSLFSNWEIPRYIKEGLLWLRQN